MRSIAILLLLSMVGCMDPREIKWSNPNRTPEQLMQDSYQCEEDAQDPVDIWYYERWEIYKKCMESKGWVPMP